MAAIPLEELGDREDSGDEDKGKGGVATGRAATGVGRFRLCCTEERERQQAEEIRRLAGNRCGRQNVAQAARKKVS